MKTERIPHIRWMIRNDMPQVLDMENASFPHPWSELDFMQSLCRRNVIGRVAEYGEEIVGFMVYATEANKLHVMDLAVHPKRRRQGVGTAMVAKLVSNLSPHRRTAVCLEVHEENLQGQLFYRSQGFQAVRVLQGFYVFDGGDAYRMEYRLDAEEAMEMGPCNRIKAFMGEE